MNKHIVGPEKKRPITKVLPQVGADSCIINISALPIFSHGVTSYCSVCAFLLRSLVRRLVWWLRESFVPLIGIATGLTQQRIPT